MTATGSPPQISPDSLGRRWLTVLAVTIVMFEMATVLVLRTHYTIDVFTAMVTGLLAAHLADRLAGMRKSLV